MRRNEIIKELIDSGVEEKLIRELTRVETYDLLMDILREKKNIQVSLDLEDVELCFPNTKYLENYILETKKPKRFTKKFLTKLSKFLFESTLHSKSGIFMIETPLKLSDRELNLLTDFYTEFSERYLQEADFFVGIGIKVNSKIKTIRFYSLVFYDEKAVLCQACYKKVAKYITKVGEEHIHICYECSTQQKKEIKRQKQKNQKSLKTKKVKNKERK